MGAQLLSHVWLFATPWAAARQSPLSMDFPGKNTRVGCHFLLQGIFPTQRLNPPLLHWQADSIYRVAMSFFRGSSQPRARTWVSCIAGRRFTVWATREALFIHIFVQLWVFVLRGTPRGRIAEWKNMYIIFNSNCQIAFPEHLYQFIL